MVSRRSLGGPGVPRGALPGFPGSPGARSRKVREGSRSLEKVREGLRQLENVDKVRESSRKFERVKENSRESLRRLEKVLVSNSFGGALLIVSTGKVRACIFRTDVRRPARGGTRRYDGKPHWAFSTHPVLAIKWMDFSISPAFSSQDSGRFSSKSYPSGASRDYGT